MSSHSAAHALNIDTLIIATAGHVDHGKTALVKQITGTDTDTLAEEKARGLTINPGFAYYHLQPGEADQSPRILGIVDVPGHTDFINNMLAGTASVDGAMLIVAADDGIMPQTREHLAILDLLGLNRGLAVITKTDRADAQRIQQVTTELEELLAATSLGGIPIFPASNLTGEGIEDIRRYLATLFETGRAEATGEFSACTRYLIDRSFVIKGVGTVVTGGVRAGQIHREDRLQHSASGEVVRVRGIRLDQAEVDTVAAGGRAALNVNLDHDRVKRGEWLVDPALLHPVQRMDVRLRLLDPAYPVRASAEYHLHIGAAHHVVNLRQLGGGDSPYYQIKCHDPMIAHYGDRFVLRDPASSNTIGGGSVMDIFVPRRGRASELRLDELAAMDRPTPEAITHLIGLLPHGLDLNHFAVNRNVQQQSLMEHVSARAETEQWQLLKVEKQALAVVQHQRFFTLYSKQITDYLASAHIQSPNQQGVSEPALNKAISFSGSHHLFQAVMNALLGSGAVAKTGTLFHLPTHRARLSEEEEQFLAKIRPILLKAGNVPPRTRELVELTGIPLKPLERILRQTTRAGSLVQVADNRHYLPETIMEIARFTETLADSDEGFSVIQFRDASGIGRNLCIEILEYFDRIGYTRRDGNSRFLRTELENIFSG